MRAAGSRGIPRFPRGQQPGGSAAVSGKGKDYQGLHRAGRRELGGVRGRECRWQGRMWARIEQVGKNVDACLETGGATVNDIIFATRSPKKHNGPDVGIVQPSFLVVSRGLRGDQVGSGYRPGRNRDLPAPPAAVGNINRRGGSAASSPKLLSSLYSQNNDICASDTLALPSSGTANLPQSSPSRASSRPHCRVARANRRSSRSAYTPCPANR